MKKKDTIDDVLSQIRSCLDAATSQPGLVKASVYQTEGYLAGIQGRPWETPVSPAPTAEDPAAAFLYDVRQGSVSLRGRVKKDSIGSVAAFKDGLKQSFPEAESKPFLGALARLWVRWQGHRPEISAEVGRRVGILLKQEYEEGVAGDLSAYLLDDRIHLRRVRDYLCMRGWLRGMIESLRRRSDWKSREKAKILSANFASIVLRALHGSDVDYASKTVSRLPAMIDDLDRAIERLGANEPEAAHFLRNNRLTVITRALHSGYLDYPEEAARELPSALKKLNEKIAALETASPEEARSMRSDVPNVVYRALTNGKLDSL